MHKKQRIISTFVIDTEEEQILLIYDKKLNKWHEPQGKSTSKETYQQTSKRETIKQTGINIEEIKFLGYKPIKTETKEMIEYHFYAKPLNYDILSMDNLKKGSKIAWVKKEELNNLEEVEEEIKIIFNKIIQENKEIVSDVSEYPEPHITRSVSKIRK